MEVTVDGMDAVVEHTRTYLLRVTGMTVLNLLLNTCLWNLSIHPNIKKPRKC